MVQLQTGARSISARIHIDGLQACPNSRSETPPADDTQEHAATEGEGAEAMGTGRQRHFTLPSCQSSSLPRRWQPYRSGGQQRLKAQSNKRCGTTYIYIKLRRTSEHATTSLEWSLEVALCRLTQCPDSDGLRIVQVLETH